MLETRGMSQAANREVLTIDEGLHLTVFRKESGKNTFSEAREKKRVGGKEGLKLEPAAAGGMRGRSLPSQPKEGIGGPTQDTDIGGRTRGEHRERKLILRKVLGQNQVMEKGKGERSPRSFRICIGV